MLCELCFGLPILSRDLSISCTLGCCVSSIGLPILCRECAFDAPPSRLTSRRSASFVPDVLCLAFFACLGRAIPPCRWCPPPTSPPWAATRTSKRLSRGTGALPPWVMCTYAMYSYVVDSVVVRGARTPCVDFPVAYCRVYLLLSAKPRRGRMYIT